LISLALYGLPNLPLNFGFAPAIRERIRMRIIHLTASTFFGGPERQMLGLARHLPPPCRTTFLSFAEGGRCQEFLRQIRFNGFVGEALRYDTPNLPAATLELAHQLRGERTDVLLCHGYKANLVGRLAAHQVGVPAVSVARGWTGEDLKVRAYEAVDRWHLRFMDHIVCVSRGQATKVHKAGVPPRRITVIPNAARLATERGADRECRNQLESMFRNPGERIVVGAGRLSPEKGVSVLIDAARRVLEADPQARFVVFGEGTQRSTLERLIANAGLAGRFVLPGFRSDLDQLLPSADLFVLPSFTEGMPNVLLEAGAAGVPVVATAVGGTPEVVAHGRTGYLVPPDDPEPLARRILDLLSDESLRGQMGQAAREHVRAHFTFEAQAQAYGRLFAALAAGRSGQRRVAA
jgi:glycosyltransferase involved in cell wall biosynthesis